MAIPFVRMEKRNPMNGEKQFYPQIGKVSCVTAERLAAEISEKCTVTRPDIVAALSALEEVIVDALLEHKSVRLRSLGSFRLGLSSSPQKTKKSRPLIKNWNVCFSTGGWLRRHMQLDYLQFVDVTELK